MRERQPGKKHDEALKERAYALLESNNATKVAELLDLPVSTVKTWEHNYLEKTANEDESLAKLRLKKKQEFIQNAWHNIELATKILEKRLARALDKEDELDEMLVEAMVQSKNGEERLAIARRVGDMKLEDVGKISTVLGTLYDKQVLANNEATSREEVHLIKKFEDY